MKALKIHMLCFFNALRYTPSSPMDLSFCAIKDYKVLLKDVCFICVMTILLTACFVLFIYLLPFFSLSSFPYFSSSLPPHSIVLSTFLCVLPLNSSLHYSIIVGRPPGRSSCYILPWFVCICSAIFWQATPKRGLSFDTFLLSNFKLFQRRALKLRLRVLNCRTNQMRRQQSMQITDVLSGLSCQREGLLQLYLPNSFPSNSHSGGK